MAARLEKLAQSLREDGRYTLASEAEVFRDRFLEKLGSVHIANRRTLRHESFGVIGKALVEENEGARVPGHVLVNFQNRIDNDFPHGQAPRIIKRRHGPQYRVLFEGKTFDIGTTTYELLAFFSFHPNRVFSTEDLCSTVLAGYSEGAVRNFVLRVRKKIEHDPANPTRLVTVGGKHSSHGYKFKRPIENSAC